MRKIDVVQRIRQEAGGGGGGPSGSIDADSHDTRPRGRRSRSELARRALRCALLLALILGIYALTPERTPPGRAAPAPRAPPRCDCRASDARLPALHWRLPVGCDWSGFFSEVVAGFLPALAARPALSLRLLHDRCPDAFLAEQLAPPEAEAYRACQLDALAADQRAAGTVRVEHGDPCGMRPWGGDEAERPLLVIARAMSEGALPPTQAQCLNAMADEAWVPTAWHVASLRAAGVRVPIRVVPEAVDVGLFAPDVSDALLSDLGSDADADARAAAAELERDAAGAPAGGPPRDGCACAAAAVDVRRAAAEARPRRAAAGARPQPPAPYARDPSVFAFLSVFKWEHRKGPDILLRAYWRAFAHAPQSALLVLRAWVPSWEPGPESVAERLDQAAQAFGRPLRELPRVLVLDAELSRWALASLYRAVDAFVLPSRGEGWGLPAAEAMASGLPAIVTNFSGPTAFIDAANALPLPYGRVHADGLCEPDADALERLMAALAADRPRARALGQAARRSMVRRFAPEVVAALIEQRLRDALALRAGSLGVPLQLVQAGSLE